MKRPTCIQTGNVFQAAVILADRQVKPLQTDQDQPALFQTAEAAEQYAASRIADAPRNTRWGAALVLVATIFASGVVLYSNGASRLSIIVSALFIALVTVFVVAVWRQAGSDLRT